MLKIFRPTWVLVGVVEEVILAEEIACSTPNETLKPDKILTFKI